MFAKVSNASKAGFITMVKKLESIGFTMIDCQTKTGHLRSLGADFIDRKDFLDYLKTNNQQITFQGKWDF